MKRVIIAAVIFVIVISACITGYFAVRAGGERLIGLAEEAAEMNGGEIAGAVDKIKKEWDKSSILFKMTQVQKDYTEIDFLINKLQSLDGKDDLSEFRSVCLEAAHRLRFIIDSEKPAAENIF